MVAARCSLVIVCCVLAVVVWLLSYCLVVDCCFLGDVRCVLTVVCRMCVECCLLRVFVVVCCLLRVAVLCCLMFVVVVAVRCALWVAVWCCC